MTLAEYFTNTLDREIPRSQRALSQVPDGRSAWKPHERSMAFGYLAYLVAAMPSWIAKIATQDSLDIAPPGGPSTHPPSFESAAEYLAELEKAESEARAALSGATDEQLQQSWQLLAGGSVVLELRRFEMIADTMTHWAHHRGQMTVYLRLMDAKVPALFGPSADERSF